MPLYKTILALTTIFLLSLAASPLPALAKDGKLDALVRQLADKKPETQIAACQEIAALGEEAAPVGAALVETMIRAKGNMNVWQAAADALEKVAPKVQPHVLTIFLNYNSNDDKRYGGARSIGSLGEEGAAGLPVLKVLWRDTCKSYHGSLYSQFCAMLSVAPNDAEVSKLRQMIMLGKFDQILAHDADDCKQQALISILASKATDEEINTALLMSIYGKFSQHDTYNLIVERVQKKLLPANKAAEAFIAVFAEQAKKNRLDTGSKMALIAMGADAGSVAPMLKQFRMHPELRIRQEVKEILDVIDQATAVKTPEEGDVWEVTSVFKNGNAEIRFGDKSRELRPEYDRVAMFDSTGNQIRDKAAISRAIKAGVRLRLQIEKDRVLSARIVD